MWTIVITGVSRGLGAALFDQLYARGDRLYALGRRFTPEQEAADPTRVTLRRVDLVDPTTLPSSEELRAAVAGSTNTVLLHNAATIEPIGAVASLPPAEVASAVTVNLTSTMLLTTAFLAAEPANPRVVFVSSGAAKRVTRGWSVYSATKAAGEMFLQTLAAERPEVPVACVSPGVLDTDMQATIRASDFPDLARFVGLYERAELASPAEVAEKIINEHLTDE